MPSLIQTIKNLSASAYSMAWRQFSTSPPSMQDGGLANGQCDGQGRDLVSPAPLSDLIDFIASRPKKPVHFVTASLATGETHRVVSSVAGAQLMRVSVRNKNAAVRYLGIYNRTTSPPSASEIPIESYPLPIGTAVGAPPTILNFLAGLEGTTGLVLAISINELLYDATGLTAADHWFQGEYYP